MSVPGALVLGTAGHVDHGKTSLVSALTDEDTDRLAEEKRRGLSIELGYASLELPSGRALSIIDVPGHERFVRTMVAGATGIDLFLMCVAADDGVMPQTREHVAVLNALGVEYGVVAVTKVDRHDPTAVRNELGDFLPGFDIIDVASPLRAGLEALLLALDRVAARVPGRSAANDPALLHVDRSFTLKGVGTIITGTLRSGSISVGDRLTVLPQRRTVRVRSIQVHDREVGEATAGQRVALGLGGISWREVSRGDVAASEPVCVRASHFVDATIELAGHAKAVRRGVRLRVHHGTRDSTARAVLLDCDELVPGGRALCQLRLDTALIARPGDRLVLRQLAPPDTIGGGVVLDPTARRHGPDPAAVAWLRSLERGERPVRRPVKPSTSPSRLRPDYEVDDAARRIERLLRADGERPRSDGDLGAGVGLAGADAKRRLDALTAAGRAVRVARNLHFDPSALARLVEHTHRICERDGSTTLATLRDELGTTRRYAQAVLEYMDSERITVRRGDSHVLRGRSGDGVEPSQRRATPP